MGAAWHCLLFGPPTASREGVLSSRLFICSKQGFAAKIMAEYILQRFVTCPCQFCNGGIEFDASDFAKGETRAVECPHCKSETLIFVPLSPKAPKSAQNAASSAKPNLPATKPSPSRKYMFNVNITSRATAAFFATTTLCLASILVFEHLPNRNDGRQAGGFQNPANSRDERPSSQPIASQPISGDKLSGSDTITVKWGDGSVNKLRLDEVTFESVGFGFNVYLKSNGQFVGMVSSGDIHKVNAYIHGN
jgi:hypothetical protein